MKSSLILVLTFPLTHATIHVQNGHDGSYENVADQCGACGSYLPLQGSKVSLLAAWNLTHTPSPHFREVWPGAEFGSSGMSVDEEMDGVREILLNPAAGLPP